MRDKPFAPSAWSVAGAVVVMFTTSACVNEAALYDAHGERAAIKPPPAHFVEAAPSQCVPYARARSGIQINGDASQWWRLAAEDGYARTLHPYPGAVMVLQVDRRGLRGHVAYVDAVLSSREIVIDHANWHGRGEVAVNVRVVDVSRDNDWSQVRVEWVDNGQMGSHVYPVEGFILPVSAPVIQAANGSGAPQS